MFPSCEQRALTVQYRENQGYVFSRAEQRAIQTVADTTAGDVRRVLPTLPRQLLLYVEAGDNVIEQTGDQGSAVPPNKLYWTVDPSRGVVSMADTQLRPTLVSTLYYLARGVAGNRPTPSLMDEVVSAGLATAFERDFAGATYPWGDYPDDVSDWVNELSGLPATAPREHWMRRHPDGRRWIGRRAGTYLVDQAIRASGRSAAELVSTSTEDILAMGRTEELTRLMPDQ